jgi:hypothetical protein
LNVVIFIFFFVIVDILYTTIKIEDGHRIGSRWTLQLGWANTGSRWILQLGWANTANSRVVVVTIHCDISSKVRGWDKSVVANVGGVAVVARVAATPSISFTAVAIKLVAIVNVGGVAVVATVAATPSILFTAVAINGGGVAVVARVAATPSISFTVHGRSNQIGCCCQCWWSGCGC